MRLLSFRIKNFKSIIDTGECCLLKSDNILVLGGQNEAGKSAVLESLSFFRNGPAEDFELLHRRKDENPEVVCKFLLEGEDIENIFTETSNEKLKDYFKKNPEISFRRGNIEEDNFEDVALTEECRNQLIDFFKEEAKKEIAVAGEERENLEGQENNTEEEKARATNENFNKFEEFLIPEIRKFIFYNSFSDLLPGVFHISDLDKHPAVLDFQKVFNINFLDVVKKDERAVSREEMRLNQDASDDLNTYWTQKLEEGGKYNFTVKIVPKNPLETASTIEFKIDRDDGDPLFMEQKSTGFRWFSAFNLRLRALGVEESTIKNLVILIDEPGQGLHEKAQRNVKLILEELAKKGAQIIYATHHANLIGVEGEEFTRIRLVSNIKEEGTKVQTVAQFASRADQGSKDTLSPIVTAMGLSVPSALDASRFNIIVEGISDHYYLSAFKKLLGKEEKLFFLPACGVNNIPNIASVLLGWGYNFKAVFDDDSGSGRKAYNLLKNKFFEKDDDLAHEHIFRIKDCNGIEDVLSTEDFYKFVLEKPLPVEGSEEKNSKLAEGKKALLARLFLERVNEGKVELSPESITKITTVFDWTYEKFNIEEA